MQQLLNEGDRLVGIIAPGPQVYRAGVKGVESIGVHELPGPMGAYLVANVTYGDGAPDVIVPLHHCSEIFIQNP